MESVYWVHLKGFWPTEDGGNSSYSVLLNEVKPHLTQGSVKLGGNVYKEGRLTAMFSKTNAVMKYSGRTLSPIAPKRGGYLDILLDLFNEGEFRDLLTSEVQHLQGILPKFNAVFINWYRPPSETGGNMDGLGPHSDDTSGMTSDIIVSITLCEPGGEKLFAMHDKAQGEKVVWQAELADGDIVIMLPGCQKLYKHSVSKRVTHLDRTKITGGRLNITLRALKLE